MCFISQTMRPLEDVGFNASDLGGPSSVEALFDIYNDVGVSVFPKRLVRVPRHG